MSKLASVIDLDNRHLDDISVEEGLHQEKTEREIAPTGEDLIHAHLMEIEDAEDTQMKNKESIKIEIWSKVKGEIEIVQDLDKKKVRKEDKVDLILKESDSTNWLELWSIMWYIIQTLLLLFESNQINKKMKK